MRSAVCLSSLARLCISLSLHRSVVFEFARDYTQPNSLEDLAQLIGPSLILPVAY